MNIKQTTKSKNADSNNPNDPVKNPNEDNKSGDKNNPNQNGRQTSNKR